MKLKSLIATVITLSSMMAFTAQTNTIASNTSAVATVPAEKKLNDYETVMVDKVWVTGHLTLQVKSVR